MEVNNLSKLTISDLVAIDSYLDKRISFFQRMIDVIDDNMLDREKHYLRSSNENNAKYIKILKKFQNDVNSELADRLHAINPDYEI